MSRGKIIRFSNFPDNLLNKWIAEDISEDMGDEEPFYNITYFLKSKNGLMSFGFMQYEDPPLINRLDRLKQDAFIEDPVMLSPTDKRHPYNFSRPEKVQAAMIRSVLSGNTEVEVV